MDNEHHSGENQSRGRLAGNDGSERERSRAATSASDSAADAEGGNSAATLPSRLGAGAIEADWWDDSEESSARVAHARRAANSGAIPSSKAIHAAEVPDAVPPPADAPRPKAPTGAPPFAPHAPRPEPALGQLGTAPLYADGWDDGEEAAEPAGELRAFRPAPAIASVAASVAASAPPPAPTTAASCDAAPSMNALAAPPAIPGAAAPFQPAFGPAPAAHLGPRLGPSRAPHPAAKRAARATPPTLAKLPHASKADHFPAIFCRSALFRVGGADEDPDAVLGPASVAAGPVPIEAQGGANLTLDGPWPRMRDKAVWEVAIAVAKGRPDAFGPIPVNLSDFAERLGMDGKGGHALEWIWTSLRRLARCRIEFDPPHSNGTRIAGHLLLAARQVGKRREIQLDPALAVRLLEEDYQFSVDLARRRKLSSALARWLHDFLSTHSNYARPFSLPYLRGLCGYTAAPRRFPAALRAALAEVAARAPELLESFSMDDSSKSSSEWTVALASGAETRRFERPKAAAAKPPSGLPKGSKGGRGSVAL